MNNTKPILGILGAGKLGVTLSQLAPKRGLPGSSFFPSFNLPIYIGSNPRSATTRQTSCTSDS